MEIMMPQDVVQPVFRRRGHMPDRKPIGHTKKFSPKSSKNSPKSKDERLTEKVNSAELKPNFILLKRGDPLDLQVPKLEISDPSTTPSPPKSTTPSPPKRVKSPVKPKAKAAGVTPVRRNTRSRQEAPYVENKVLKQIRMCPKFDSFAGSTVYTSPSPRSLPLPTFFMTPAKKEVMKMLNLD